MFFCKGLCKTKFNSLVGRRFLRYQNNQKRCGVCDVYFSLIESKCPCCNAILHVRLRHSKAKLKYYKSKGVKWN